MTGSRLDLISRLRLTVLYYTRQPTIRPFERAYLMRTKVPLQDVYLEDEFESRRNFYSGRLTETSPTSQSRC